MDFRVNGTTITALTDRAKERIAYHIFASDDSLAARHGYSYETNKENIPLITRDMDFEWVGKPADAPRKIHVDKRPFWVRKAYQDFTVTERIRWHLMTPVKWYLAMLFERCRGWPLIDSGRQPCAYVLKHWRRRMAVKGPIWYALMYFDFRHYTARWN